VSEERHKEIEDALAPYVECVPEFWRRYHTDALVYTLTNALTNVTVGALKLIKEAEDARQ
jgi:hypothetical protein